MNDTIPVNEKREKLKEFYFKIKGCMECALGRTRTNFVFGSGNSNASIILIGEAPGKNEDLQGKPFVGQAGRLLDELLASIGFSRHDVFIANVLKCRPPENRDPGIDEINTCKKYLFSQIDIIDPRIICTMGKYSTQLILATTTGINKLRGKIFKKGEKIIIPINHPAAALYTPSRLQVLKEDFKRLKNVFDNFDAQDKISNEIIPIDSIYGNEGEIKKPEQKDIFSTESARGIDGASGKGSINSSDSDSTPQENQQLGLF